jgi:hypothetical protein
MRYASSHKSQSWTFAKNASACSRPRGGTPPRLSRPCLCGLARDRKRSARHAKEPLSGKPPLRVHAQVNLTAPRTGLRHGEFVSVEQLHAEQPGYSNQETGMAKKENAIKSDDRSSPCSTASWKVNWRGWCAIRTIP